MRFMKAVLLMFCLTLVACANGQTLREEFGKEIKAYNRMLRWQELEKAGSTYIDKEERGEFLKSASAMKQSGVTVTDFRILNSTYLPESRSGDVIAEFDYYILPSNRISTITDRQTWHYSEQTKSWKLRSGLPDFLKSE